MREVGRWWWWAGGCSVCLFLDAGCGRRKYSPSVVDERHRRFPRSKKRLFYPPQSMAPCVLLLSCAVSLLLILPLVSVLLHYWWCFHLFFPLSAVVALPLCFPLARQGCLCVNPGQLAKGTGGGSYAELAVHPMPQEMLAKKQEGEFTFVVAGINAVSRKYATEAVRATAVFGLESFGVILSWKTLHRGMRCAPLCQVLGVCFVQLSLGVTFLAGRASQSAVIPPSPQGRRLPFVTSRDSCRGRPSCTCVAISDLLPPRITYHNAAAHI